MTISTVASAAPINALRQRSSLGECHRQNFQVAVNIMLMGSTPQAASTSSPRALIVDTDEAFAALIMAGYKEAKDGLGATALEPVFIETVRAAQIRLSDREFSYAAIFLNPAIGPAAWTAVVKSAHQYRQGVPIMIIYDGPLTVGRSDAARMGLAAAIPKPFNYLKLLEFVFGDVTDEHMIPNLEAAAAPPGPPSTSDSDYTEVDLTGIVGRLKSQFDLFVRLSNGKYVRVLNSGDTLSADRVEAFKAKGVTSLFIVKTAQDDYLKFLDSMVAELVKDTKVSIEVKATHISNQAKSTINYLVDSGFSEASMQQAQQYVNNSVEMVQQIAGKSDLVKRMLDDVTAYEHSVACATLAGLLLKHIGGNNAAILNAVGVACFVHDVALLGQPPEVMEEDETKMSPEQLVIYYAHPEEGAKLVKKMKSVPPIVVTAVAQHHLRINKGGFPKEKAVDDVNRIAELIGVCHEFLKLLKLKETDASIDPFQILRARAAKEFSEPIVDAFVRTFEGK